MPVNRVKGSPRYGRTYTVGKAGEHIYGGKKGKYRSVTIKKAKPKPEPFNPLRPLTGKDFDTELAASTKLKYGPQDRQIASERRISDQAKVNTDSWYNQYLTTVQAATKNTADAYGAAKAFNQKQANDSYASDAYNTAALNSQQQQSAAQRGATVDPSMAKQDLQAAQSRRASNNSFTGLIGSQGANASAYGAQQSVAGAQAKVGALEDEAKRRRQIESAARDLEREKGDYAVEFRTQMRDAERKYKLESQAFGLDVAKEANDQANADRTAKGQAEARKQTKRNQDRNYNLQRRNADRRYRLDVQKFGAAQAKDRYERRHKVGKYKPAKGRSRSGGGSSGGSGGSRGRSGGLTPTQRRNANKTFRSAVNDMVLAKNAGALRKGHGRSLARKLAAKKHYDPIIALAAAERALYGGVSPATARKLRKLGISAKVRRPSRRRGTARGKPKKKTVDQIIKGLR